MKIRTFARIEGDLIAEVTPPLPLPEGWASIIPKDGDVRILYGYPAEVWVETTGLSQAPQANWLYSDGKFVDPSSIPPDPELITASNASVRDAMMDAAAKAIAPLQDAADLGQATDSEASMLKRWKQFRVDLIRVDILSPNPVWPEIPKS